MYRAKGGTFADFAGIVAIPGPNLETDEVETTELDPYQGLTTPAAYVFIKKFIGGWTNLGEIDLECNFTQVQFAAALTAELARTNLYWRIDFRNGYSFCSVGFIKGLGANAALEDIVKMAVKIKLTDGVLFSTSDDTLVTGWGA